MDRNFHIDDFERLLREKSDEFRMYPSKRIWHSIYNNIHPGRKWPSVAMSITLITTLLLIGYLNTNNPNLHTGSGENISVQKMVTQVKLSRSVSQPHKPEPTGANETPGVAGTNSLQASSKSNHLKSFLDSKKPTAKSSLDALLAIIPQQPAAGEPDAGDRNAEIGNTTKKETIRQTITEIDLFPVIPGAQMGTPGNYITETGNVEPGATTHVQKTQIDEFIQNALIVNLASSKYNTGPTVIIQGGNSAVEKNNLAVNSKEIISAEDKAWIENYALYHRPATKKWANRLSWQKYVTPSVVYRKLYNDPNFGNPPSAPPMAISSNQDIYKDISQKPGMGLEIGTGLRYSISKIFRLNAGIQFNYTRYNSEAYQNTHPFTTRITMHDYASNISYEEIRTTPYSNKSGLEATNLHNETFQISLPVGADIKLIGNENLQWYFGVTIQPTYVAGGKSYLISTDRRNYVKETAMINRWNLNAGFETFLSFKASNGLTYQIGPQFRTQLFSTNNRRIAIEEKLLNYGLKFGVAKTIK